MDESKTLKDPNLTLCIICSEFRRFDSARIRAIIADYYFCLRRSRTIVAISRVWFSAWPSQWVKASTTRGMPTSDFWSPGSLGDDGAKSSNNAARSLSIRLHWIRQELFTWTPVNTALATSSGFMRRFRADAELSTAHSNACCVRVGPESTAY